jgi:hypothetical protein
MEWRGVMKRRRRRNERKYWKADEACRKSERQIEGINYQAEFMKAIAGRLGMPCFL